jgi:hypothetical protein
MRLPLTLLAIASLCAYASACGGDTHTRTGSHTASTAPTSSNVPAAAVSNTEPALRGLRGDEGNEDDDESASVYVGTNKYDNDSDFDNDLKRQGGGYYDGDDNGIRAIGHAAGSADLREVSALVKRYYAAAAVNDGRKACSMLTSTMVRGVPEDYGRGAGPDYLRGAKTCAAVMSRFFKHYHSQLTGSFKLTGLRISGDQGFAQLGSKTMPASVIYVEREGGLWKVKELRGGELP